MAGRMVDLGQVGFGLVADTEALKASLEVLKAFGRETDRLSKMSGDASQAMAQKFMGIERALTSMQVKASQTVRQMTELGASADQIKKVETALSRATNEVSKFGESIERNRLNRATIGFGAVAERELDRKSVV